MLAAKNELVAVALMAVAFGLLPSFSAADPIIPNASFSLGNSGFASGYTYLTSSMLPATRLMYPEGTYTVGASPAQYHSRWPTFGDHTTGDGGMLIVNGSPSEGVLVWSATVDVDPGTQYDFSAWAASVFSNNPAKLAFSINGTMMDAPFLLGSDTGAWQRFSAGWYSGNDTTALLSLIDLNTVRFGNDFALDDIALSAVSPISRFNADPGDPGDPGEPDDPRSPEDTPAPVPEPASMILFGTGMVGLAGYFKRRYVKKTR